MTGIMKLYLFVHLLAQPAHTSHNKFRVIVVQCISSIEHFYTRSYTQMLQPHLTCKRKRKAKKIH